MTASHPPAHDARSPAPARSQRTFRPTILGANLPARPPVVHPPRPRSPQRPALKPPDYWMTARERACCAQARSLLQSSRYPISNIISPQHFPNPIAFSLPAARSRSTVTPRPGRPRPRPRPRQRRAQSPHSPSAALVAGRGAHSGPALRCDGWIV